VYGTVRTVVWEDGGGDPASYPIVQNKEETSIMELSSGAEDKIELSDFTKLDDEGYKCQLNLMSKPFAAEIEFWFDLVSAKGVVKCLENIHEKPREEAKLGFRYEQPYIQFKGDGLGHIEVSGLLVDGPPFQRLEFTFQSDQTLISGFLAELKDLLEI
jgi:hypothetical protein